MKKLTNTTITFAWIAGFLLLWSFGSSFSLPPLGEIPHAWIVLVREQGLIYELWRSFALNAEVVVVSTIISVTLGYLVVDWRFAPLVSIVSKFRFFGMAGFVVIFTRFFGGGHALKVSMLVFIMSSFFVTSMIDVVQSVTREEYDHARTLRLSPFRVVWEVVVRGRMAEAFDALRQNASIGWMSLTMVEGLSRYEGGIGVIMLNESKYRNLAAVFAAQLTVLAVGIAQDVLIGCAKNVCCPYAELVLEKGR